MTEVGSPKAARPQRRRSSKKKNRRMSVEDAIARLGEQPAPPPRRRARTLAATLFRGRSDTSIEAPDTPSGSLRLATQLWGGAAFASGREAHALPWRHPDSEFRERWVILVMLATVYSAVELPVELAFFPQIYIWSFKFLFDLFGIDLFFAMDIWVTFQTGFVEDGVVVMDYDRIRRRYLRGGLAADVVSTLPVDVIMAFAGGSAHQSLAAATTRLGRLARLSRLVRLGRIARLFRHARAYVVHLHEGHVRIMGLTFALLLFAHWDACLLFLSARVEDFNEDRTWAGRLGLQNRPVRVQYVYSLFKAFSHMLCIGYGSVSQPLSTVEVLLTTVSMLLGAAIFAGIIGSLTAYLMSLDSPAARYDALSSEADEFMERHCLPAQLRGLLLCPNQSGLQKSRLEI